MPRAARQPSPTGYFHVTSRAVYGLTLFDDPLDYTAFEHGLARAVQEDALELHAYCLLGTHFHLLVRNGPVALSIAMKRVKGWYASCFNQARGRFGTVFAGRYSATPLASEQHAYGTVVYIAMNPVRAHLVRHPDGWAHGSHAAHAGLVPMPSWLTPLRELGVVGGVDSYRAAVEEAVARHRREDGRVRPQA